MKEKEDKELNKVRAETYNSKELPTEVKCEVNLEALNHTREIEIVRGRDRIAFISIRDYKDKSIALVQANLIVKSVNSHTDLLAIAKNTLDLLIECGINTPEIHKGIKDISKVINRAEGDSK